LVKEQSNLLACPAAELGGRGNGFTVKKCKELERRQASSRRRGDLLFLRRRAWREKLGVVVSGGSKTSRKRACIELGSSTKKGRLPCRA